MALGHDRPFESCALSFLDLPTEVRFQIYGLLTPASRRLWLRQSTYYAPLSVDGTLVGSAENSMFRCRYPDQISCLQHWGLGHLRILPDVKKKAHEGNQDKDKGDCIGDHATLLSLRAVNREISSDVSAFLFTTTELWIQFDAPFLAFLKRAPFQQYLGNYKFAENSSIMKPPGEHLALRRWLSMFRHLTFFMHEGRLLDLENLNTIFHAGLPSNGMISRGQRQFPNPMSNLHFVIIGFDEIYYPPVPERRSLGGSGNLPQYMLADQTNENPTVSSVFRNVQRRGNMNIWRPDMQKMFRGGVNDWSKDYIYYRINWDAKLTLPASTGDGGWCCQVQGQYINWTKPGLFRGAEFDALSE